MTFDKLLAGLKTLAPYYNDLAGHHTGAEHDTFYCYPTDRPLDPVDIQRMVDLGWRQDVEYGANDEFTASCYQPSEGWEAFT